MATDKRRGEFFTGVRERGLLNAMLDAPAKAFERSHPDMKCKWEFAPTSGDVSMLTMREAQGYRVVDAAEISGQTDSAQKTGPLRRGDLVLMAAPTEIHEELLAQDAEAADLDYKTPETTYKEHMANMEFRLKDGTTRRGKGFGEIRRTQEETPIPSQGAVATESNTQ